MRKIKCTLEIPALGIMLTEGLGQVRPVVIGNVYLMKNSTWELIRG